MYPTLLLPILHLYLILTTEQINRTKPREKEISLTFINSEHNFVFPLQVFHCIFIAEECAKTREMTECVWKLPPSFILQTCSHFSAELLAVFCKKILFVSRTSLLELTSLEDSFLELYRAISIKTEGVLCLKVIHCKYKIFLV